MFGGPDPAELLPILAMYTLVAFAVFIVVMLVAREFFCWYSKINERVALLKEIRDNLQSMQLAPSRAAPTAPAKAPALDNARSRLGMQSSDLLARAYNTPNGEAQE